MPEQPHEGLLHRELHVHDVKQHFADQLSMLRDVVNYGSNLIPATFTSSPRQLHDIVVIPVLLKQLVSMLDAFEVLIANACIPASQLQSRAAFEASISIDYILLGDEESKAQNFYVANIRRDLEWARRTIEGDPSQVRFFAALGEFADTLEGTKKALAEPAAQHVAEIEEFLAKDPWRDVNARLQQVRGDRPHDLPWYVPFGPKSIRQLSDAVGRRYEYEVFYSASSEKMHGSDYKSHIKIVKGAVTFEPIRYLEGISSALNWTLSIAFHSYRKVLERYRPGQLQEFNRRYVNEWREAFRSIKQVQYSGGPAMTI